MNLVNKLRSRVTKNIFWLKLFLIAIVGLFFVDSLLAAQSYNVPVGSNVKINEHGQCRYVQNTSAAAAIFISTNSLAEWTSFYSNTIPGVSWNACCAVDYYRPATTCVAVGNGYYAAANDEIRYACTNQPANTVGVTYSGPGGGIDNCPYSAVTCVTDYRRPTATTCTACTSGQYNPNNNTNTTCSSCTNVPAGAASATYTGTGGGTNNCPYNAVTCLTDYRRPTATTCTACTSGQYNPNANTNTTCSSCTNLPANAYSAIYSGTGGGANNCPYSSVTCTATYYRNTTTSCAICNDGRYSGDGNTASAATCAGACTNTVAGAAGVTYSGPGSTATNCPIGSVTCATDYRRPTATTCSACTSGQYNPNGNTSTTCSTCTNLPANAYSAVYSGTGSGTNNCPISSVTCDATYYRNTTTSCAICNNGRYSADGNTASAATCTGACTNSVSGAASVTYSGPGSTASNCPISSVTCATDYRRPTATTCSACTSGQYNPNGNTSTTCSTCTNLPANAYSAVYSGTGSGTNNCPISSVTCDATYYRNTTTSCAICSNGRYSADGNTASAATCSGACTNSVSGAASVTYSGPGSTASNCPIGSVTCATDYRRPTATTCSACTSGQYNPNGNTSTTCSSCTNKPANAYSATYSGTGGGSNNCPVGSVTCNADYYRNTTTSCAGCGTGTYTAANNTAASCTACTNKPANSSYSGTGGGSNNCPWTCNSGYTQSGGTCVMSCTAVAKYTSCFTAGTKVLMADGSEKSIEQIKVGESVLTYDEKLGFKVMSTVTEALHHPARMQPMYTFIFENGDQFTVTAEHLIYSYSAQTYLPAAKLARTFRQGHDVYLMNTSATPTRISSITMKEESVPTYNLHVEGLDADMSEAGRGHNYFASGQLVHNAKMCEDGSSQPPIILQQAVNCQTSAIYQDWDDCGQTYYEACSATCP